MMKTVKYRPIISILIIAALVGVDQLTKYLALVNLSAFGGVPVINGVLSLYYVENTGISFSLLSSKMLLIVIITVIILAAIVFVLIRTPKTAYYMPLSVILSVIVAGALGNLIDRIIRGFVIDFISLDIIHFPVFNVADICVCIGIFVLILLVIFKYKEDDFGFIFKGKSGGRDSNK